MKQCAGDSSESRKCLNLSSSSHTPAVREGGVGGGGGVGALTDGELSSHRQFLTQTRGGGGQC